jgi:hypothetical protein
MSVPELRREVFRPEDLEILKHIYQHDPASLTKLKLTRARARILREITAAISRMRHSEHAQALEAQSVCEALDMLGLSLPEGLTGDLLLPAGYDFADMRIHRLVDSAPRAVSPCVMMPITRIKTTQTQEELLEVVLWEDDGWRSLTINRSQVSDTKKITQLSDYGVFVSSVNAKELVRFFHHFLEINQHAIPVREVSNQLGWVRDSSFLLRDNIQ